MTTNTNNSKDEIICKLYEDGYTLRHIGEMIGKDHHYIERRLIANNITIEKHKTKKPYTDEHRKKISMSCKGRTVWITGKKHSREAIIKNMKNHLKYDVSYEWIDQFEDLERVKYLNHALCRKRDYDGYDTNEYKKYIEKFYNDEKFVRLFNSWKETGDKYIKPSLDHLIPKSKGGTLGVDNIQFISWFENRAKNDIPFEKWEELKRNINNYL